MRVEFFELYLKWGFIIGCIFIAALLLITTGPVSRMISRSLRKPPLE